MYGYYGIDYTYIIFILPAIIISLIAQMRVTSTFGKYNKIQNSLFRKINCIHSLMQKCVDYSLITNHTINTSFHVSGCMECPFHKVNCV